MSVRVNGLILGKFMSTLNPALHLKLPVDARNGARNVLVFITLKTWLASAAVHVVSKLREAG